MLHLQAFKNIQIIQREKDKPAFDLLKTYSHATYDKISFAIMGHRLKRSLEPLIYSIDVTTEVPHLLRKPTALT